MDDLVACCRSSNYDEKFQHQFLNDLRSSFQVNIFYALIYSVDYRDCGWLSLVKQVFHHMMMVHIYSLETFIHPKSSRSTSRYNLTYQHHLPCTLLYTYVNSLLTMTSSPSRATFILAKYLVQKACASGNISSAASTKTSSKRFVARPLLRALLAVHR